MYLEDLPDGIVRPLQKITITCPHHGPFLETALNHIIGYGCPICDEEDQEGLNERIDKAFDKLISK